MSLIMMLAIVTTFAQVQRKIPSKKDSVQISGINQPITGENRFVKKDNKQMLLSLGLSKEQWQKLKEMRQDNKAKREVIQGNDQLTESQKLQQLKELRTAAVAKLQEILSAEQLEKLQAMKKAQKDTTNNF